jgi:hypothetical protein
MHGSPLCVFITRDLKWQLSCAGRACVIEMGFSSCVFFSHLVLLYLYNNTRRDM